MDQRFVTPETILARGVGSGPTPCMSKKDVVAAFGGHARATAAEVLDSQLSAQHRLWVVLHPIALSEIELMACALAFARHALARHGEGLPEPGLFRKALAVYDAWLCGEATPVERDAARDAVTAVCRSSIRSLARTPALAAGLAVACAGRQRSFEAARMAAYYARRAAADPREAEQNQIEIVRSLLAGGVAAHYRRDVAASEVGAEPLVPLDANLICIVTIQNNTSQVLENGPMTEDHGYTTFIVDSIPPGGPAVQAVQGIGKSGAESGTTGTAAFSFAGSFSLMLKWNIPYTASGMGDGMIPYFYAMLQGPLVGAANYRVDVSNLNLDMCQPPATPGTWAAWQLFPVVTLSGA